jgi:hypothetical protein
MLDLAEWYAPWRRHPDVLVMSDQHPEIRDGDWFYTRVEPEQGPVSRVEWKWRRDA